MLLKINCISEEKTLRYKCMKNKAKKVVLKAVREKAEEGFTELKM